MSNHGTTAKLALFILALGIHWIVQPIPRTYAFGGAFYRRSRTVDPGSSPTGHTVSSFILSVASYDVGSLVDVEEAGGLQSIVKELEPFVLVFPGPRHQSELSALQHFMATLGRNTSMLQALSGPHSQVKRINTLIWSWRTIRKFVSVCKQVVSASCHTEGGTSKDGKCRTRETDSCVHDVELHLGFAFSVFDSVFAGGRTHPVFIICNADENTAESFPLMDSVVEVNRDDPVTLYTQASCANNTQQGSSLWWNLDRIDQLELPLDESYSWTDCDSGQGVVVYVVDTGVRITHNEFEGRASHGINTLMNPFTMESDDDNGHGTHVGGTCARPLPYQS